jgi:DNA-binding NtrC family response regulator
MTADGYRVRLAENGRQLLQWVYHNERLDLLIMDPDLPDIDVSFLLTKLQNRVPFLPVVVHTFLSDYSEYSDVLRAFPFVEKKGSSVEHLKKIVHDILYES